MTHIQLTIGEVYIMNRLDRWEMVFLTLLFFFFLQQTRAAPESTLSSFHLSARNQQNFPLEAETKHQADRNNPPAENHGIKPKICQHKHIICNY